MLSVLDFSAESGGPAANDVLLVVDVSDTAQSPSGSTRKITLAALCAALPAITAVSLAGPLTGDVTGNVTGNVSGSAATVTAAAQPAITSLGTLVSLAVAGAVSIGSTLTVNSPVINVGVAGSGSGGQLRCIDDSGTVRWVAGVLANIGQRNFSIYDNARAAEIVSVDATTGNVTLAAALLVPSGVAATQGIDGQPVYVLAAGTSPIAARLAFASDDSGWQFAIAKNVGGVITDLVTVADNGTLSVSGEVVITTGGLNIENGGGAIITGGITGTLLGNASTATKLAVAHTINGVAFDGSADITISLAGSPAGSLTGTTLAANVVASSLTSVGTLVSLAVTGNVSAGSFTGPLAGNASTATKLAVARTINGVAFDGSANITISAVADASLITGTTLAANVVASSLTSVGTLTSLTIADANGTPNVFGGAFTLANTASKVVATGLSSTSRYGLLVTGNGFSVVVGVHGGATVFGMGDNAISTIASHTAGNAGTINFFVSSGSLTIENLTGVSQSLAVFGFGSI